MAKMALAINGRVNRQKVIGGSIQPARVESNIENERAKGHR
jgi:hypothetical protein